MHEVGASLATKRPMRQAKRNEPMLQKWTCLWVFTILVTNPAWSEEPSVKPGIKKQRVSPKLLREAMALPEYKAQASPATIAPPVDHLQKLSDKLKTAGDQENSELLQHFIQEHQRLARLSASTTEAGQLLRVRCQAIDIDLAQFPQDSILQTAKFDASGVLDGHEVETFHKELNQAVHVGKGVRMFEPVTLTVRPLESAHFHQGNEVLLPSSDGSPSKTYRETGTLIDVLVTPLAENSNRVDLSVEVIHDAESSHTGVATTVTPPTHQKAQATFEARIDETSIVRSNLGDKGHQVFLITRVTHKK